jgi:hypothetical protein
VDNIPYSDEADAAKVKVMILVFDRIDDLDRRSC